VIYIKYISFNNNYRKLKSVLFNFEYLHNSVVIKYDIFQSFKVCKTINLPNIIVRKINSIKLIESCTHVFNQRYFITYNILYNS